VKDIRFWAPIIFSIPLTIVCFIVGAASAGVGHGDALPLVVLFPYSVALTTLAEVSGSRDLSLIFILSIVLQYPLYGLVIAVAWLKRKLIWAVIVVIALHLSIAGYFIIHDL
jgi:hypothetical protein